MKPASNNQQCPWFPPVKEERKKKVTEKSSNRRPGIVLGRLQRQRQQCRRHHQGLLKERRAGERRSRRKRRKRGEESERERHGETGRQNGEGRRREKEKERRETREECAAWLSVAIINHVLVSRLAPRRQGYLTKGIRQWYEATKGRARMLPLFWSRWRPRAASLRGRHGDRTITIIVARKNRARE